MKEGCETIQVLLVGEHGTGKTTLLNTLRKMEAEDFLNTKPSYNAGKSTIKKKLRRKVSSLTSPLSNRHTSHTRKSSLATTMEHVEANSFTQSLSDANRLTVQLSSAFPVVFEFSEIKEGYLEGRKPVTYADYEIIIIVSDFAKDNQKNTNNWYNEVAKHPTCKIALFRTKTDLEKRGIITEALEQIINVVGGRYFELLSTTDPTEVARPFLWFAKERLEEEANKTKQISSGFSAGSTPKILKKLKAKKKLRNPPQPSLPSKTDLDFSTLKINTGISSQKAVSVPELKARIYGIPKEFICPRTQLVFVEPLYIGTREGGEGYYYEASAWKTYEEKKKSEGAALIHEPTKERLFGPIIGREKELEEFKDKIKVQCIHRAQTLFADMIEKYFTNIKQYISKDLENLISNYNLIISNSFNKVNVPEFFNVNLFPICKKWSEKYEHLSTDKNYIKLLMLIYSFLEKLKLDNTDLKLRIATLNATARARKEELLLKQSSFSDVQERSAKLVKQIEQEILKPAGFAKAMEAMCSPDICYEFAENLLAFARSLNKYNAQEIESIQGDLEFINKAHTRLQQSSQTPNSPHKLITKANHEIISMCFDRVIKSLSLEKSELPYSFKTDAKKDEVQVLMINLNKFYHQALLKLCVNSTPEMHTEAKNMLAKIVSHLEERHSQSLEATPVQSWTPGVIMGSPGK